MAILVAAMTAPWPEHGGARRRLAMVVRGLAHVDEVDLVVLVEQGTVRTLRLPQTVPARRVLVVERPRCRWGPWQYARWLVAARAPRGVAWLDYREVRARMQAWSDGAYRMVWCHRAETYVALRGIVRAPTVVDFDDLENELVGGRVRLLERSVRPWHDLLDQARVYLGRRDAVLWSQLQAQIAREATAVVVCSDIDRRRLGMHNCAVVPNGYPCPERSVGRLTVAKPPVLTFHGTLGHPPNVDAARFLVERIAPCVWAAVPDARIRLVGRHDRRVGVLHAPPRVTVTGYVEDISEELARADLVVVPLRYGGGTRLKILEAFAHGIPVVSTSIGAEGLGVRDGVELLIGDDPEEFAGKCVRALTDPLLRRRLVEAARMTYLTRFRSDRIENTVAQLAVGVIASLRADLVEAATG